MDQTDRHTQLEGDGHSPAPSRFDRSDLGLSATLLAICAVLYWDTTRWAKVPASLAQNTPPTLFPRLVIGAIVIMALMLPFERIWKRRAGLPLDIGGGHASPKPVVFVTAIVMTLAVYFMPILGVLPVMVAATAVLPLLWGERRYAAVAVFAIALPLAVASLFAFGLKVNLGFGLTGDLFR